MTVRLGSIVSEMAHFQTATESRDLGTRQRHGGLGPMMFALGALVGGCATRAASSPQDLVRRVVEALRSGDPDQLRPVLPTEQDFRDLFRRSRDPKNRNLALSLAPRLASKVARKVRSDFENVQEIARAAGIRWAEVVVDQVLQKAQPQKFPPDAGAVDLWARLRAGTKRFRLWLDDCFSSARGWVIGEHLYWRDAALGAPP